MQDRILYIVPFSRVLGMVRSRSYKVKYVNHDTIAKWIRQSNIDIDDIRSERIEAHYVLTHLSDNLLYNGPLIDTRDRYIIGGSPPALSIIIRYYKAINYAESDFPDDWRTYKSLS